MPSPESPRPTGTSADFVRRSVPEARRPHFTGRGLAVLVLAILVAVWLRQSTGPTPGPTMKVVPEQALDVVDLPIEFVRPAVVPEKPPLIPPGLPVEERQRRLEALVHERAEPVPEPGPHMDAVPLPESYPEIGASP